MTNIDPNWLPHWVVTDKPADCPDSYVARLWFALPEPRPTGVVLISKSLDELRERIVGEGFCNQINRAPEDDPVIVETWFL
jgi:hypothetical protein